MNNPMQMIQAFMNFKNQFTGDPRKEVERLVASGKMSQERLNQLQKEAAQFQSLMNRFKP